MKGEEVTGCGWVKGQAINKAAEGNESQELEDEDSL